MSVLKNARHELFAQEVAKGATAAEAYGKAGYSPNRGNATTLKANQNILARVDELKERGAVKASATVERIVQELESIAFSNISDVMSIKGQRVIVKSTADLPREVTAAIAGIKKTKAGIEVRFHNKPSALDALARHKGMYRENINLSVTVSLLDLVMASYPQQPEAPKQIEGTATEILPEQS